MCSIPKIQKKLYYSFSMYRCPYYQAINYGGFSSNIIVQKNVPYLKSKCKCGNKFQIFFFRVWKKILQIKQGTCYGRFMQIFTQ